MFPNGDPAKLPLMDRVLSTLIVYIQQQTLTAQVCYRLKFLNDFFDKLKLPPFIKLSLITFILTDSSYYALSKLSTNSECSSN